MSLYLRRLIGDNLCFFKDLGCLTADLSRQRGDDIILVLAQGYNFRQRGRGDGDGGGGGEHGGGAQAAHAQRPAAPRPALPRPRTRDASRQVAKLVVSICDKTTT